MIIDGEGPPPMIETNTFVWNKNQIKPAAVNTFAYNHYKYPFSHPPLLLSPHRNFLSLIISGNLAACLDSDTSFHLHKLEYYY